MDYPLSFLVTFVFDAIVLYIFRSKFPFGKENSLYKKVEYVIGVLVLMVVSFACIRASISHLTENYLK